MVAGSWLGVACFVPGHGDGLFQWVCCLACTGTEALNRDLAKIWWARCLVCTGTEAPNGASPQ